MAIDLKAARDFVYQNGTLWERALFAYLFQGGSVGRLQSCLRAYKNPDNGYGHALEHDLRCPESHPAALEFLLSVMVTFRIPPGDLLHGTAEWVEANQNEDGSLRNPPALLDYPLAPWWTGDGGQTIPDSIVGNLMSYREMTDRVFENTLKWTAVNLTEERIRANDWLFMAYHAYDFYKNVVIAPDHDRLWTAAQENIVACAEAARPDQYYQILRFVPDPTLKNLTHPQIPDVLVNKMLDHLETAQQPDGSWHDEHTLPQWYPYTTILVLFGLRNHKRLG